MTNDTNADPAFLALFTLAYEVLELGGTATRDELSIPTADGDVLRMALDDDGILEAWDSTDRWVWDFDWTIAGYLTERQATGNWAFDGEEV